MFGHHNGFSHIDGDGGDFGAVNLSETVERHFAVGALTASDADETASLAHDTGLVEVVVGTHNIVGTVGLGGLLFDILVFLGIGSGEFGYILIQLIDEHLVVFQFGKELGNLGFLLGDALFLTADKFLKAGAFFAVVIEFGLEAGNLLFVGSHEVFDVLNLGTDLVLDAGLAFDVGTTEFLDSIVAGVDGSEVFFNLVEGGEEGVEFGIFILDDGGKGVVCLDGGIQFCLMVVTLRQGRDDDGKC